jgi:hypothetical protein
LLAFFLLATTLAACFVPSEPTAAAYGAAVPYRDGGTLLFPDFDLEYKGARSDRLPNSTLEITYHDFVAATEDATMSVTWSAGTGDIGPTLFTIGSKDYLLEMAFSDRLGRLPENTLVVTPADE